MMTPRQKAILRDIRRTKQNLINQAKRNGISENFGQKEMRKLQDKYDYYGLAYGSSDDRCLATEMSTLEDWAMEYTG